ncbi:nitroreductase family deazaflavin-dependent oxidoreductase [Cryobacterium melibiosiphilum]|uniref:Nitroreductase family deazaflavin-dependent oxidoreductase n=1 Tax=Cryobacterium melibiosiphilum TaxID=995039 RepID=A0A3A5MJ61_9MICO|nr:nitroreductase/quinone reductase family protein [Cryobacterium melibiosiphilum]RJT86843.1 nitroreductase family deazaflavin-dependent oxidoreductase [Cryobacterium melibiosiphilum]
MSEQQTRPPKLPPRWFIRAAWVLHRGLYRLSGGRLGLRSPIPLGRFGMMRLTTIGRRSGEERVVILGYVEDGPNLVSLAMNGWADGDPAWWLNLQARPDARVQLTDGSRPIRAHRAEGAERERLWHLIGQYDGWGDGIDNFANLRSTETAVVVFAPRSASGG